MKNSFAKSTELDLRIRRNIAMHIALHGARKEAKAARGRLLEYWKELKR